MDGNTGGCKNGGGIGANPMPACATPSTIDWEPTCATGDVAFMLAAVANDSA